MQTIPSHRDAWATLSADEQAHCERVTAHIRDAIVRAGGWLDFGQFMQLALYAPGLGYYSTGTHKLGVGGDFTTAPHVSSLFSRCLARQCAEALQQLSASAVLELGAGTGVMAADILLELEALQVTPQRYYILEVSADLRTRQQALLQTRVPHLLTRIEWLEALPSNFVGVVLANEVLDALPVARFVMQDGLPQALGIAVADDHLVWQMRSAAPTLLPAVRAIETNLGGPLPEGYCSEVNLQLPQWLRGLADAMQRGIMLFIDYGYPQWQYYSQERQHGTLSCFFRQRMHDDPLINVGLQDITAWVDFTALAEAGMAAGLELIGFATQAHFLLGGGLQQLLADLGDKPDVERWQLSQQVQKLTLPGEMGEAFKVIAFAKDCEVMLSGFGFRDLRERL